MVRTMYGSIRLMVACTSLTRCIKGLTGKGDPEIQQDGQHLYYVSPDRQELRRVDENLVKPNGIVGTPDGKHLYVADPGDKKTYLYDIEQGGDLSNRRLFVSMGSDGMVTLDNEGNLYITREGVRVFNQQGDQIELIEVPESPSNVVFAGSRQENPIYNCQEISLWDKNARTGRS